MDAENNVLKAVTCMREYNAGMDRDNNTLETFVHSEYAKYC